MGHYISTVNLENIALFILQCLFNGKKLGSSSRTAAMTLVERNWPIVIIHFVPEIIPDS